MTNFEKMVQIDVSPARVWDVLRDVERWPEWTPSVVSIHRLDAGRLAVGKRVRILQPKLRPAVWKITEFDEDARLFTWVTQAPGVRVAGRHEVVPSGDGSRARLSLEFSGWLAPLISRLLRRLNESYLDMEAIGLKQRSECLELSRS